MSRPRRRALKILLIVGTLFHVVMGILFIEQTLKGFCTMDPIKITIFVTSSAGLVSCLLGSLGTIFLKGILDNGLRCCQCFNRLIIEPVRRGFRLILQRGRPAPANVQSDDDYVDYFKEKPPPLPPKLRRVPKTSLEFREVAEEPPIPSGRLPSISKKAISIYSRARKGVAKKLSKRTDSGSMGSRRSRSKGASKLKLPTITEFEEPTPQLELPHIEIPLSILAAESRAPGQSKQETTYTLDPSEVVVEKQYENQAMGKKTGQKDTPVKGYTPFSNLVSKTISTSRQGPVICIAPRSSKTKDESHGTRKKMLPANLHFAKYISHMREDKANEMEKLGQTPETGVGPDSTSSNIQSSLISSIEDYDISNRSADLRKSKTGKDKRITEHGALGAGKQQGFERARSNLFSKYDDSSEEHTLQLDLSHIEVPIFFPSLERSESDDKILKHTKRATADKSLPTASSSYILSSNLSKFYDQPVQPLDVSHIKVPIERAPSKRHLDRSRDNINIVAEKQPVFGRARSHYSKFDEALEQIRQLDFSNIIVPKFLPSLERSKSGDKTLKHTTRAIADKPLPTARSGYILSSNLSKFYDQPVPSTDSSHLEVPAVRAHSERHGVTSRTNMYIGAENQPGIRSARSYHHSKYDEASEEPIRQLDLSHIEVPIFVPSLERSNSSDKMSEHTMIAIEEKSLPTPRSSYILSSDMGKFYDPPVQPLRSSHIEVPIARSSSERDVATSQGSSKVQSENAVKIEKSLTSKPDVSSTGFFKFYEEPIQPIDLSHIEVPIPLLRSPDDYESAESKSVHSEKSLTAQQTDYVYSSNLREFYDDPLQQVDVSHIEVPILPNPSARTSDESKMKERKVRRRPYEAQLPFQRIRPLSPSEDMSKKYPEMATSESVSDDFWRSTGARPKIKQGISVSSERYNPISGIQRQKKQSETPQQRRSRISPVDERKDESTHGPVRDQPKQ